MSTGERPPGANVAALRNARGWSQVKLARKANVSLSLLSKVEVGDRTLTHATAAALAKAMGLTVAEVLGRAPVLRDDEQSLSHLRSALRDYDAPDGQPAVAQQIAAEVARVGRYRDGFEVRALLKQLPGLLRQATTHAYAVNTADAWMALAEVYSAVYWVAARHRWMDMAELAVTRQRWAVEQKANPLGGAVAARDRAGAYLNGGDYEGGLALVDRAIVDAEAALSGPERAFAVGVLNLRGMTLAGRVGDKMEGRREAERHIASAWQVAEELGAEWNRHSMLFGTKNTATHVLATRLDLGMPRDALLIADDIDAALTGLTPTRVAATRINIARARLDVGDRDGALESLSAAYEAAPQMAKLNPMGREVLRVVSSLHLRSNPTLLRLAKLSGVKLQPHVQG
ncbi:helix-turn-helix transcriptional regulator [Streptomyces sp. NPDC047315]|uniref:helix-turn-helix domain-containing protein n=1 Tax=Streptomyces sp. NPDC047315 TaxID=3155142 RepID=UPI0033C41602